MWEAADDNVTKELQKKGQREGVTLTILRSILESKKVFQEGKFGGSIPGNSSQNLCEHAHSIFKSLRKKLREPNACKAGVTGEVIDTLLKPFVNLYTKLDICCKIMRSTDEQTDDAIDTFKETSVEFGIMWRNLFGSALPKVHCLETHCSEQLEFWGTLGEMDENVLETMQKEHKKLTAMLNHMKDYEKREKYLQQRQAAMNTDEVVCSTATCSVEAGRKMKFSIASLAKRKEKMKIHDKDLLAKVEAANLFVGKSVYDPIVIDDEDDKE
jgi:hypothetical protein